MTDSSSRFRAWTLGSVAVLGLLALAADTVPTDIQMPGTQPTPTDNPPDITSVGNCGCHSFAPDSQPPESVPVFGWQGGMMANAGAGSTEVYEAKPAMSQDRAAVLRSLNCPAYMALGWDRVDGSVEMTLEQLAASAPGTKRPTFHFVLNNEVCKDDRIPPSASSTTSRWSGTRYRFPTANTATRDRTGFTTTTTRSNTSSRRARTRWRCACSISSRAGSTSSSCGCRTTAPTTWTAIPTARWTPPARTAGSATPSWAGKACT